MPFSVEKNLYWILIPNGNKVSFRSLSFVLLFRHYDEVVNKNYEIKKHIWGMVRERERESIECAIIISSSSYSIHTTASWTVCDREEEDV